MSRITAVVGVCNEVDLIGRCIQHLRSIGIDHILVADNGSDDGTETILDRLVDLGHIKLERTEGDPHKDADFLVRAAKAARNAFDPEWILIQDADEFWFHAEHDIQSIVRHARHSVLQVDRYNACLSPGLADHLADENSRWEDLDLFVRPLHLSAETLEREPDTAWIAGQPLGKILARADVIDGLQLGGHHIVDGRGETIEAGRIRDALIVHIPFSTLDRFRRKIESIDILLERKPDLFSGRQGWHWRRWVEIAAQGRLDEEFFKQFARPETIEAERRAGNICSANALLQHAYV
jgi:hypothetical protein